MLYSMSKVKLLLEVSSDLRSLAESLQAVADAMVENEASRREAATTDDGAENKLAPRGDATASDQVKQEKQSGKKADIKKQYTLEEEQQEKQPSKKAPTKKQYTLEEVRGLLAEKSQNGLTAEVKALIEKYGGNKLSDIKAENYAAMIKEAKVLGGE